MQVIVPRGFQRETDHLTDMQLIDAYLGVGQCDCPECSGTGDWTPFYPEELPPNSMPCVECKGTGKIYIGV